MATVKLSAKAVGSIVKLKENGKLVDFYVAKHNYESGLNGSGRTLLVRKDCYDRRQWHDSKVNAYATSAIDTWLNGTYKNLLDANIRTQMGATKFYYTPGNNNWTVTTLERSVFLLSATELGQTHTYLNAEGTALSIASTLKIAKLNGSAVVQWTRSPHTGNTDLAWYLEAGGSFNLAYCTGADGIRPAFTLPSTLFVSDDGSVTVNTAPGTPSSISVPSTIQGGKSVTISWGKSTDAEGNLEGYELYRSTDGGSSWSNIYKGSGASTTNSIPFGTESVMYRVRAYDSEGLYSSYKTSGQVMVVNNNAPNAPGSITVPAQVLGGGPLSVTWSAASDPDGNLSGYELERQVDGGQWTQVYKGTDTGYTDTVQRGWTSVNYRVRAYDSYDAYSPYTTGTPRTVDNNHAPVITCGQADGTDLGKKTEGFTVSYSVTDEDGDAVTVTEAVDGAALRTFSAVLGSSNTLDLTGEAFMKVLNGSHVLTVAADDGKIRTTHRLNFEKLVTEAAVTLKEPFKADAKISVCVLSVAGHIPADADFTVEVTNNANDAEPAWEDCTAEVLNGGNHVFENETAEEGFAFNFRLRAKRGGSGQGGYINSIKGGIR